MKLLDILFNRKTRDDSIGRSSAASLSLFGRRSAGVVVTQDNALTYSALWRCVNLVSQSIGALPWQVNEREIDSTGRKSTRQLIQHPAASLLDLAANDEVSAQHWRETLIAWALTWGNGYAEIERDRANRPVALWQIEPDRVNPDRTESGRLVYDISNGRGSNTVLESSDVFHLRGLGFDGLVGYSVVGLAARTIGLGLATENFGSDFFGNGAHVGGVFEHPNSLGDQAIKHLKASIKERQGGANQMSPMILEEGMKYTPTSIPPDDAQFLETRKFNVAEIARWYGVPLHKLHEMDKASFNNIEHQSIEFVQDALIPWVRRLETEANLKLVSRSNRGRVFTKLNLNSLLRGDMESRDKHYQTMANLGAFSVNDILELEDRNPIGPEGDKRLVQLNQTTLDKIGEDNVEDQNNLSNATNAQESDEDNEQAENRATAREIMVRAMARSLSRENHRAADALSRYDGDRDGLIAWMDKFYNQHRDYMRDALILPLQSVKTENGEQCLENWLDIHITTARLEILEAFDSADDLTFTGQADSFVDMLLEGIA